MLYKLNKRNFSLARQQATLAGGRSAWSKSSAYHGRTFAKASVVRFFVENPRAMSMFEIAGAGATAPVSPPPSGTNATSTPPAPDTSPEKAWTDALEANSPQ
jgi:hypothetical protein